MDKYVEKPMDTEIALYYIRLLRAPCMSGQGVRKEKQLYAKYASKALSRLTNPFAISMLRKELAKIESTSEGRGDSEVTRRIK